MATYASSTCFTAFCETTACYRAGTTTTTDPADVIPGFNFDYTDPFDVTNPWKPSYILEDIVVSYSQTTGNAYYP